LEWQLALLLIMGILVLLMASGMPVAFCFMLVNVMAAFFLWGGQVGLEQFIGSLFHSVASFVLLPLPLFILMGEVAFRSGIASHMLDALDKWIGRVPGRLSLLAVAAGTVMATMTGASIATVAMLGTVLLPEMEKRKYRTPMSVGPILGSGGLAIMIPPSSLAVLLGALGEISVGKLLIAIIIPGLLIAALYATYIISRSTIQPFVAPPYDVTSISLFEKIISTGRYVLPLGFIVFLVVGLIFLGVATPTEAAATGAFGTFILALFYRRLNWKMVRECMSGTLQITGMVLLIVAGATAFSQTLAYIGVTKGLIEFTMSLPIAPILVIISMQIVVLIMGCFMEVVSIMMITLPLFMPVVRALRFDPVWFGVLMLINVELASKTPPFGLSLFVMKGVAPPGTTMADIYRAVVFFVTLDLTAMVLIMLFPIIALWLPGFMH
jgi:tripartite ATP-independent transporter DctM subunit